MKQWLLLKISSHLGLEWIGNHSSLKDFCVKTPALLAFTAELEDSDYSHLESEQQQQGPLHIWQRHVPWPPIHSGPRPTAPAHRRGNHRTHDVTRQIYTEIKDLWRSPAKSTRNKINWSHRSSQEKKKNTSNNNGSNSCSYLLCGRKWWCHSVSWNLMSPPKLSGNAPIAAVYTLH